MKRLSAQVGRDLTLTQGAGGNTSIKQDGVLWVKASGKWLANAEQEEMFLPVDLRRVRNSISTEDPNAATPLNGSPLRASIETSFHALLPQNVVIHVHSVNAIAWAVQRYGFDELEEPLKGLRWRWVPYARPGLPLTHLIAERMTREVQVWILANHGLIVTGATVEEAEELLEEVEQRLFVSPNTLPTRTENLVQYSASGVWKLPKYDEAHQAAALERRDHRHALIEDVFAGDWDAQNPRHFLGVVAIFLVVIFRNKTDDAMDILELDVFRHLTGGNRFNQ